MTECLMVNNILPGREIIFEIQPYGNALRVMALDVATMTEIVLPCPRGPDDQIKTLALKRLEFVLRKKGLI